jgi:predicted transglutaminase-like cysteine proteinase
MKTRTPAWKTIAFILAALLLLPATGVGADTGSKTGATPNAQAGRSTWQPWSENLFAQLEKEYGPTAMKRLRYVHDTARENQNKPVLEKLEVANSTLSRLPWVSDQQQWNADDYWATPLEMITKVGGDCEDMAIGKYVMLRMMGVPRRNLALGFAILKTKDEAHMVLVWANEKRTDFRVLDSFVKEVKHPKQRPDLQFVYLMNADNEVFLIDDSGGKRALQQKLSARKIEKLDTLRQKISETRDKYKQYNDGKPLFND